jgi:ElaB/YqjD/DUF883 family membrane-anchored ribosome-binding protein
MTDFMESTPGASRRPDEIESDIRRTRDRMGEEIDAIGDRLRPERIRQRAKQAVKQKGANLFRTAKDNPVPTAIVALGLTLLLKARSRDRAEGYFEDNGYSGIREKTHELAGNVKEKAQDVVGTAGQKIGYAAEQVTEKARRTGGTLQDFFERNPIIAGAGVAVLGAALGALIPETEKEKKLMGPTRDQLAEKTKHVVQQAQGAIEQKMSER